MFAACSASSHPAVSPHHLALAWATLDAFKVMGRAHHQVEAEGGPLEWMRRDPLELLALRDQSRVRAVREPVLPIEEHAKRQAVRGLIAVARRKAASLRPFLEQGGAVFGGAQTGRLLRASSPPLCVYGLGDTELLEAMGAAKTVAIVGTRQATESGLRRAAKWAGVLAQHGVVVVSGGAVGIDSAAHRGALDASGATVAVLGDSVRAPRGGGRLRPRRVEEVFASRAKGGRALSLTASGPWVHTGRSAFVSRNRLVAALADAVVVVEAAEGSGALHTVKDALALNTPVFAVPGDPDSLQATATNTLIASGKAAMATTPYAVLEAIGVAGNNDKKGRQSLAATRSDVAILPPLLRWLADHGGTASVDDVAEALNQDVTAILQQALTLELEGRLQRQGSDLVWVR